MTMATWISMSDACHLLGVRPQTVYAYVSRGKLEVMPDPHDTRRSLYRAEDVAGLAKRKQDGRKYETLATKTLFGSEPSIPTALCSFIRGHLYYRGQDVVGLAQTATLEDVAHLLWGAGQHVNFSTTPPKRLGKPGRLTAFTTLATTSPKVWSVSWPMPLELNREALSRCTCALRKGGNKQRR
jgi:citrate synthase